MTLFYLRQYLFLKRFLVIFISGLFCFFSNSRKERTIKRKNRLCKVYHITNRMEDDVVVILMCFKEKRQSFCLFHGKEAFSFRFEEINSRYFPVRVCPILTTHTCRFKKKKAKKFGQEVFRDILTIQCNPHGCQFKIYDKVPGLSKTVCDCLVKM